MGAGRRYTGSGCGFLAARSRDSPIAVGVAALAFRVYQSAVVYIPKTHFSWIMPNCIDLNVFVI